MKHIVIDARSRPASTGRYVDRLLEYLQKIDGVNQYTVLLKPDDSWNTTAKNFTTKSCPYAAFSFNPLDQFMFASFIKQLEPDLVHFAMTPQEPIFYSGRRITTTHDLTMLRFARPGILPGWLHEIRMVGYRILMRQSLKKSSRIIVPSNYVKNDVAKTYPFAAGKITVTYEASDPQLGGKAIKPEGIHEPFILHVGSPFPHKNIERLVGAFELMKEKSPNLKLVLAGKKEQYFERLEAYVQHSNSAANDIIFTGYVSDSVLKWLYEHAECYVLPALSEGFGLPGLEAMAHGCPVACSNSTSLPEIYGDAAHYFDPAKPHEIAAKTLEVISTPRLKEDLVRKGFLRLKNYSWQRMAEQTLAIYNEVLGGE